MPIPLCAIIPTENDPPEPVFSLISMDVGKSFPMPPYASGNEILSKPKSPASLINFTIRPSSCASIRPRAGITFCSINSRQVSAIIICSSSQFSGIKIFFGTGIPYEKIAAGYVCFFPFVVLIVMLPIVTLIFITTQISRLLPALCLHTW